VIAAAPAPASLALEVRRLALPAILHSCLQTLVFVVDRAMLGRLGETPLAAMQIAGPLEWSVFSVLLAFEVGTVARVGHYVGARRPDDARATAAVSLVLAVAFGLIVLAASPLVIAHLQLVAPRASLASLAQARDYLAITLRASPVVFLAAGEVAILQASGDTRTPLIVAIACNVLHVALNRVLILGAFGVAPMGTRGCAISTALTFALEAALLGAVLLRRGRGISLRGASGLDRREAIVKGREILRVAAPSVLERALYHAGFLGFVTMIGRLGDLVMASNQALVTLESICFLSGDGFGIAAAALVAQKLGADRPLEAQRAARIAARDAVILLSAFGVLLFAFRDVVVGWLVPDPDVVRVAGRGLLVLMVAQPFMALSIVFAQALRGAGRTREVLWVTSFCAIVVRLGATYAFAFRADGGLRGVWCGSTSDWIVRAALLYVVFGATLGRRRRAAARE
jgi:putative MATE family efflux protein